MANKGMASTGDVVEDSRYSLENHEKKARKRSRKVTNAVFVALAVVVLAVGAFAAWNWLRPPDIADYANQTVRLVGLSNDDIEISPEQLVGLSCQSVKASGSSDRTGQGTVVEKTAYGYGPTLDEVIGQWGYSLDDFDRVVVRCLDGYEVVLLPGDTLDGEVYLSVARGKDALPEAMRPMRLIMPYMASGQWAYGIESIVFESLG